MRLGRRGNSSLNSFVGAPRVSKAENSASSQISRRASDRRGADRRKNQVPVAVERRGEARRKVQRRRQIDPTTCEREYSGEELEFMHALDAYKRSSGRMFPTCSEILEVIRGLGYVKQPGVAPATGSESGIQEIPPATLA